MDRTSISVESIVVGTFEVNCWIVWSEQHKALVIDPGAEAGHIAAFLKQKELDVAAYLLTHGHMDHVSGLADLHAIFPAPIGMHAADLAWAFSDANQMPPYYDTPRRPSGIGRDLRDGDAWTDAGLSYRVMATPGHTLGSVCFLFESAACLFTGDTLFAGSIGRTDFPGSDPRAMQRSLRIFTHLAGNPRIYPGHGPVTDLATEKTANFFLQSARR